MTVSTSTSVQIDKNELIKEAFEVIGVGSEGEAITADMYRRGSNSLNLMIQTWNADDNLWRRQQETVVMIADQAAYVLDDPKPLRVPSARRAGPAGYEVPMTPWSRQQYLDQPDRKSTRLNSSH